MVLGHYAEEQVVAAVGRNSAHRLYWHRDWRAGRIPLVLFCRAKPDAIGMAAQLRAPVSRVLPHGAGARVRSDLRRRVPARTVARHSGARDAHHRRAREALCRGGREYRYETGGRIGFDRRKLDADGELRRATPGAFELRKLHAVAV